jgi:chromosome segregation ATPase
MSRRTRRVYFEDDLGEAQIQAQRTRGSSHTRTRSRSAERVHSIVDDASATMQGRERFIGRDSYDQLQRENQYLRIEVRELANTQAWITQLEQENADLQRENRELRRSADYVSDTESRKDSKLSSLRKKYAKLEVEASDLKAKLSEWKAKATDWRRLYEEVRASHKETKKKLEAAEREKDDAIRRIEVYRQNLAVFEAAKLRLEKENDTLKRDVALEERLRRRHY